MEALLFMRFVTYLSIVGLGVNAYVKRSANDTTITSTSTTTRPFINRFDPMNMNYNAPIDMTWVELGYDPNFNGQQTVPATLDGLPGARQNNKLFFNQAEKALDLVPLSISNALFNKIRTSAVADEDFLLMSNLIMASLSDAFISSMSIAQQDRAVQSRMAGVMGLNHLIQRRLAQQPPSTRDNEELFGVDSVRCGVLLWKLRDSSLDQRLVPYDSLFELPLDQMKPLKQFLPGLTLTMARSFLTSISTDAEGKTALVIDSFPGTTADWLRHRGVCSSLFLAVYNNIAAQADQWNPPGYDNLKDKIVPMFSCVKPSYLLRFRFNELWPMIDELSSVDLDWQRGSAIVQQIFETSQSSDYNDQFFVRLNQLNRFLTIDLIQTHRFDDIFMNALLTKNSLVAISDQTNDPLLLEWLYSEVRSELYPNPLSGITSSVDMYTLGTMVAAMTVADIRSFQPRAVKENVGAFQSKGLTPGQMVTLVDIYMTEGNFDVLTLNSRDLENLRRLIPFLNYNRFITMLNSRDLENLRRLIPFLNYNRFITMEVSTINLQLVLLKDLAVRSRHKFPLTPAQKFAISGQLTVSTSKSLTEMVVTSLGPELSMELPPQVFLSELQSLSQLGFEVNDNGEVQLTSAMGEKVASQSWSDFQKTVIYKLYRKEAGPLTNVNEKALLQLKKLASGITTQDIFSSQFSSVIGITNAVMTNGGNMGKAWLLSLQIRRAFAAMYGLRSIDEFDLSLLGTANLMALDGLTLRMFSVKEMEGLNAADCQDVISKIGGLEDVYLIPHPKRRELVCFYIERCRFDYSPSQRNFVPSSSSSILQNYNPDDPRINRREYRYARKVFNYCDDLSPVSLTSGDFEILGHLACDIPASVIDAPNFPTDVLWMFHDCWFTEAQGKALFKKLTTGDNQELLYTDTTIAQLSHSLCSIVPPQHATVMRSKRYRKEIIDFVQYSYVLAKKMQETYGLTKRHLNKDIFWQVEFGVLINSVLGVTLCQRIN
ncbi:uncharacterized protein LOC134844878 [Symsagittifera roscoffensis]|uniref:uncharacterized protein LOC134844878 n=1 Tax=Symsagittifera roscoffensis TaxID=84072 RepID=UPI00307BE477